MTTCLPPSSGRWTPAAKEELLVRIRRGELTETDAMERFDLSAEELSTWSHQWREGGRDALRSTRR